MRRILLLCAAATVVIACSKDKPPVSLAIRRDSAGVQIVENRTPLWTSGHGWTVGPEPVVSIGAISGDPAYQLSQVRGILRDRDGRIAVADGESGELRFFDSVGTFQSASGRKGGGPGEFQQLGSVVPYRGDSLLAWDYDSRRFSILDRAGTFARSAIPAPVGEGYTQIVASFADGSLLGRMSSFVRTGMKSGVSRDTLLFLRFSATGGFQDSILRVLGGERYIEADEHTASVSSAPFGRETVHLVGDSVLYIGTNDAWEIAEYARSGALRRLIRRQMQPRPLVDRDVAAWKAAERASMASAPPQFRERFQQMRERMPLPTTPPSYESMLLDPDGGLWVKDYRSPADSVTTMTVFDSTGQFLGTVRLPDRFDPTQVARDFMAGTYRDEDDVEYVRVYRIGKGE